MIDIKLLRGENATTYAQAILKKEPTFNIDQLMRLDKEVRELQSALETLRSERNSLASRGAAGVTEELRSHANELNKSIKAKEEELAAISPSYDQLLLSIPNAVDDIVPLGNKESNTVVKTVGTKPTFSFTPKNHLALNEKLHWFDLERAAIMSGGQFVIYRHDAVKMIYALTRLMLRNNASAGFEPVLPPYLVRREAMVNNSSLPKFDGDFYETTGERLSLIPTAEVTLTNLYADTTLSESQLPIRHTAWTSCFRREAGGYGSTERGLIRIHQFEKVEIYSFCHPEKSDAELDYMITTACKLLDQLGLHYRISLLAAQDTSFASARTYDIEAWLPGQGAYYEVSSCSNVRDFQSRRAKIRYKSADKKTNLVHTLNASALALPRLMIAILETYQQPDGSIKLPKILQDEMNLMW